MFAEVVSQRFQFVYMQDEEVYSSEEDTTDDDDKEEDEEMEEIEVVTKKTPARKQKVTYSSLLQTNDYVLVWCVEFQYLIIFHSFMFCA